MHHFEELSFPGESIVRPPCITAKVLILALVLPAVFACKDREPEGQLMGVRLEDGWLRGDLHGHTTHSDGYDGIATTLAVADAWRSDTDWLRRNPGLEKDHLHFYAVTDHRTVSGCFDPDFAHEYLIPICGKEWGGPLHACVWEAKEDIPHEPLGDETVVKRISDSIAEAHAQDALFSLAHPLDSRLWSVPVEGFDAIEIWNAFWSLARPESTIEQLEERIDRWGGENPAVRVAVERRGVGNNGQALRFWQAWLSLGVHTPPVGGGDRHFVFPGGMPTTYVKSDTRDTVGIIGGIRTGQTFVSRSPQGPQIIMEAHVNEEVYPMGSALPSGLDEVSIAWRATRAAGGQLRMIEGTIDPSIPDPSITVIDLPTADETGVYQWLPPTGGGWLHAVVVDPLPKGYPEEFEPTRDAMLSFPKGEAGDRGGSIMSLLGDITLAFDLDAILDPTTCDPKYWEEWMAWCMPVAQENLGSVFLPLELQAYFSVEFENYEPTGYAMGAISSAFFVR